MKLKPLLYALLTLLIVSCRTVNHPGEGTKALAESIFGASLRDGVTYTKENLSRKQIVPLITEKLK